VSIAGILFLVALIALFVASRHFMGRNEREAKKKTFEAQLDPQTSLERFFLEIAADPKFKDAKWQGLLEYVATDDRAWLEANRQVVASLCNEMSGVLAMAVTENEQRYGALKVLLGFGPMYQRPLVARVERSNQYAVAFTHLPNRAETMKEVFMIQENDRWRIRRFLGKRDDFGVMSAVTEKKRWSGEALDADEDDYVADPHGYETRMRAKLLNESGIQTPAPAPVPGAQPSAAPLGAPPATLSPLMQPGALSITPTPAVTPLGGVIQ
jgi:hypothetical protein